MLDPYDIALCKLKRDIDRDFQDVLFLARTVPFDLQLFEQRYREELRSYLFGDVKDADYTFDRWIEAIKEDRARTSKRELRKVSLTHARNLWNDNGLAETTATRTATKQPLKALVAV